jgi:hypothetical protein
MKEFARERAVALPELAVGWTLAHPAVDVAIVGAHRPSQLEGTVTAAALHLSQEDLGKIDAILADAVPAQMIHPGGPKWTCIAGFRASRCQRQPLPMETSTRASTPSSKPPMTCSSPPVRYPTPAKGDEMMLDAQADRGREG